MGLSAEIDDGSLSPVVFSVSNHSYGLRHVLENWPKGQEISRERLAAEWQ